MHKKVSSPTVSLIHQGIAGWHYNRAIAAYMRYLRMLTPEGLLHPKDLNKAKFSLSVFRRHMRIGDTFMKRPGASYQISIPVYTPDPKDVARWPDDFELALIQRGNQAKAAAEKETA